MLEPNNIYNGNCLDVMKEMDNESINCCVTSPPYWALRDYGIEEQLGLEPTFDEYIDKLCNIDQADIFRETGDIKTEIKDKSIKERV